jgi:Rod binding domain-containing protein
MTMKNITNSQSLNSNIVQSNKTNSKKYIPKPYVEAAQSMEKQFVKLMIDEMKKTSKSETPASTGMDYYMDLESEERAKAMVQRDQIGLQDLILDKIYPEKYRNVHAFNAYQQQMGGPIKKAQQVEMQDQTTSEYQDIELHKVNSNKNGLNGLGSEARND